MSKHLTTCHRRDRSFDPLNDFICERTLGTYCLMTTSLSLDMSTKVDERKRRRTIGRNLSYRSRRIVGTWRGLKTQT
eukprot:3196802-Pleurochrysis_carterae.AAC.2